MDMRIRPAGSAGRSGKVVPMSGKRVRTPRRHATSAPRDAMQTVPAAVPDPSFLRDSFASTAFAPGKRLQLTEKAAKKSLRLANYVMRHAMHLDGMAPCIEPLPQDRRFINAAWSVPPYDVIYQSFLMMQQWWHNATTGVRGVTRKHE